MLANGAHLSDAVIYRLLSDVVGGLPVETAMLSTFSIELPSDAAWALPVKQLK